MPVIHFDFGHLDPKADYVFNHGAFSAMLQAHTPATLAGAREDDSLLRVIPDARLSHFVSAELPESAVALLWVSTPKMCGNKVTDHVLHMAIHVPEKGRTQAREAAIATRGTRQPQLHPKLLRLGLGQQALEALIADGVDPEFPKNINTWQDATDAGVALLFQHGNLINLNADSSIPQAILDVITAAVTDPECDLPDTIHHLGDHWLVTTPAPPTTSMQPDQKVILSMKGPLNAALKQTQNMPSLQGQQWNYRYGVTQAEYAASHSLTGRSDENRIFELQDASPGWITKNITEMNGLSIDPDSISYMPPTGVQTFSASGIWSANDDTPKLTGDIVKMILAGTVSIRITDATHTSGLLIGLLTAGTVDPDTGMTPFIVTFAPVQGAAADPPVTATANFMLNSGSTGLAFAVSVAGTSAGAALITCVGADINVLYQIELVDGTQTGQLTFECTNSYLRHLSAHVQYLDSSGKALDPVGWNDKIPAFLRAAFENDPQKPFAALIPPVTTVFGIPIPANPTTITIPMWDEVHTVRLLLGGLGRGTYDSAVCPIGITVTALVELALPVFLLAAGTAVTNSKTMTSIMADNEVLLAVCAAGAFLVAGPTAAYIGLSQNPGAAAAGLAAKFGPLLLSPATSLGQWVAKKISESAAEKAAPFVDIALLAINMAVTAAELCETIVEVLDSPFVFEADLSRSMNLTVTIMPDPRYNKFPDYHHLLRVTIVYDTSVTSPVYEVRLPSTTLSDPITVTFNEIPAGGSLRVYVFFYAGDGWQSGQGNTDWIPALPDDPTGGTLTVGNLAVTTNDIPLNKDSVYIYQQKTVAQADAIVWSAAGGPPQETVASPSRYPGSQFILASSISMGQSPETIGYSWQATGLGLPMDSPNNPVPSGPAWTAQTLSLLQHPQHGYDAPPISFSTPPGMVFNMFSSDGGGNNYFVDSSNSFFDPDANPSGGWHLRALTLTHDQPPTGFDVLSNKSCGRFTMPISSYAYHPQGYVFGLSTGTCKLFRLQIAAAEVEDALAPTAVLSSGQGIRDGMMDGPVAVCVAPDGRVLVLEANNCRVQAFDIYGNAVPYFNNPVYRPDDPLSPKKIPTMALKQRQNSTYLDLSIEAKGYLFVLSYTGSGAQPELYQVDLYAPSGEFMVTTPNIPVARIVVDILRNLYTMNYELFQTITGRVLPSISMWLPPAPPADPNSTILKDQNTDQI